MFLSLEKGSWGFQAGAESIDSALVFMNRGGVDKLLANKVWLGRRRVRGGGAGSAARRTPPPTRR